MICPCCSQRAYAECCEPFHTKKSLPPTALELMRSRYSAYAQQLSSYIIETTHPQNPLYEDDKEAWKQGILRFCQETQFQGLEIIDASEKGDSATVTFSAKLEQRGHDASFTEKSHFLREKGKWLYEKGKLIND